MSTRPPGWSPIGALALVGFVSVAPGTQAQTRPVPRLPELEQPQQPASGEDTGDDGAARTQAAALAPPEAPRGWVYAVGLGAGWESNVGLKAGPGDADFGGVLNAQTSRRFRDARGSLTISANALGYKYAEQGEYDSLNGDLRLNAERRLAATVSGALDLSATSDQSYNTGILIEQGVLLPATRVLSYSGTAALSLQLGARTALRGTFLGNRTDFPDETRLLASSRLRLSTDLDRRVGANDTLSLTYSAENSGAAPPSGEAEVASRWWTHYLSTQWSHRVSPRTTLLVEAGASYTPEGADAGLETVWSFFGGGSVERQVGRGSFGAYYRREVVPLFGVGTLRLVDRVGLNVRAPFGQRWQALLSATYSGGGEQDDPDAEQVLPRQSTTDAIGSLAFRATNRLWLTANGRYLRQSGQASFAALQDERIAVMVIVAAPGTTPSLSPWR